MATVDIITDGACSGNPGPGGWATIIVTPDGTVTEFSGSAANTTNNQMELQAIIVGLQKVDAQAEVHIHTDSQYVINGITKWVFGWQKNGWRTKEGKDVENQEFWKTLVRLTHKNVHWHYVKGHNGHAMNERANTLAQQQARSLGHPVLQARANAQPQTPVSAGTFPHYISLVGSEFRHHATWDACKQAVHGVSGARFKKVSSAHELASQRRQWGLPVEEA
ncbi:MAG: ribonuclease HI [Chloroflexota bacterium]|jgi:ribonuclease HI